MRGQNELSIGCVNCKARFHDLHEYTTHKATCGQERPIFLDEPEPVERTKTYREMLAEKSNRFNVYKRYLNRLNPGEPDDTWSIKVQMGRRQRQQRAHEDR